METLQQLKDWARQEDWGKVDDALKKGVDPPLVAWAINLDSGNGLQDPNAQVRDLAASIIERCDAPIEGALLGRVLTRMDKDPNKYVRFRLAFALAKRDMRKFDVVRQTLHVALRDEEADVREKAEEYLREG